MNPALNIVEKCTLTSLKFLEKADICQKMTMKGRFGTYNPLYAFFGQNPYKLALYVRKLCTFLRNFPKIRPHSTAAIECDGPEIKKYGIHTGTKRPKPESAWHP